MYATRLPKNYRLVFDILMRSGLGTHRATKEVIDEAKRLSPQIGDTTVYRALMRLRDLGLVREVNIPGGNCATYEPMGPPHAHFRCGICKTITDVEYVLPDRTVRKLAKRYAIDIEDTLLSLRGTCAQCRWAHSACELYQ